MNKETGQVRCNDTSREDDTVVHKDCLHLIRQHTAKKPKNTDNFCTSSILKNLQGTTVDFVFQPVRNTAEQNGGLGHLCKSNSKTTHTQYFLF